MTTISGVQNGYPQQGRVKDNPGFFKKLGAGMVGGLVTAPFVAGTTLAAGLFLQNKMVKINRSVAKDSVEILNKAGDKILRESGLADKGVKIFRTLPEDMKLQLSMGNPFKYVFPKIPKKLDKFLKLLNPVYQTKLGRNAFFDFTNNRVVATNKIALSQFHELGHAMNHHNGGFGKLLQNLRLDLLKKTPVRKMPVVGTFAVIAASVIGLVSVFKNKKAEGEKPKGIFDTVTTFIKNNVGKLTFLTMLPIVLEEGLASFKGEKAVKGLISNDLFKKVKLSNRIGLASYATLAVITGLGAYWASKIRDKIAQPNLNK
ncbi:hypothetical protein IJS77_05695 [bacterium]|nr:hypothetical protein [bacterium]